MELLEQLEKQVVALLDRLDRLKTENARLRTESAAMGADKAALEEENLRLLEALEKEEQTRKAALGRIDALLHDIQEHDSVE